MSTDVLPQPAAAELPAELLAGLCAYQPILLAGQPARAAVRPCDDRWRLIEPHLPHAGVLLDVGSNFGWFGLQAAMARPGIQVLSAEADDRSAAVQRAVLASHGLAPESPARRMFLVTRRLTARRLATLESQRFAAAFCLSVLHWMPDHQAFLRELGGRAERIFVEHPSLAERGAGSAEICQQIGDIGDYLRATFPARRVMRLGHVASHRGAPPRALWMIEPDATCAPPPKGLSQNRRGLSQFSRYSAQNGTVPLALDGSGIGPRSHADSGLDVIGLLRNELSWPPRSWWQGQRASATSVTTKMQPARWFCTTGGLQWTGVGNLGAARHALVRRLQLLPEGALFTPATRRRRRLRRALSGACQWVRAFGARGLAPINFR